MLKLEFPQLFCYQEMAVFCLIFHMFPDAAP